MKQCVLLIHLKRKNTVQEPGYVVFVFLADSFSTILESHKQPDLSQRLPGILKSGRRLRHPGYVSITILKRRVPPASQSCI